MRNLQQLRNYFFYLLLANIFLLKSVHSVELILDRLNELVINNEEASIICAEQIDGIRDIINSNPELAVFEWPDDAFSEIFSNLSFDSTRNDPGAGILQSYLMLATLVESIKQNDSKNNANDFSIEIFTHLVDPFQQRLIEEYVKIKDFPDGNERFLNRKNFEDLLDSLLEEVAQGSNRFDHVIISLQKKYNMDVNGAIPAPTLELIFNQLKESEFLQPDYIIQVVESIERAKIEESVKEFAALKRQWVLLQVQNGINETQALKRLNDKNWNKEQLKEQIEMLKRRKL